MNFLMLAQVDPAGSALEAGEKAVGAGKEITEKLGDTSVTIWEQLSAQFHLLLDKLPQVLLALAVLIVGWIVALIISKLVGAAIRRIRLGSVTQSIVGEDMPNVPELGSRVAKGVFYLLMLFVLVAFFQTLSLTIVTEPLNAFLNQVFAYAPRIVAVAVLLFVAWILATGVRFVVRKVLAKTGIDRRLTEEAGVEEAGDLPLTNTISEASYWLVYLLFLPLVLDALDVPGLLGPVQGMLHKILGFLPQLFGAAVILAVGWFIARVVQRVVTNLLVAAGADQLSERVGLTGVMGKNRLSSLIGLAVYVLLLIPVVITSFNALGFEAVTQPASDMLQKILDALPGIFAAFLIVAVAYVVGRLVSGLAVNVLSAVGFDQLPARLGLASETTTGRRTLSEIAGTVILVAIVLFAAMQGVEKMGFELMAGMILAFLVKGGDVLAGLVIFGIGLFIGRWVSDLIVDSNIRNARLLGLAARISILVIAAAMGLQQMGLDLTSDMVKIAFGATVGGLAIAFAVAFGIGGRDVAKKIVDDYAQKRLQ